MRKDPDFVKRERQRLKRRKHRAKLTDKRAQARLAEEIVFHIK